jgi:hypothetical protein
MSVTCRINQKMGCFRSSDIHGWVNCGASISVESTQRKLVIQKSKGNRGTGLEKNIFASLEALVLI